LTGREGTKQARGTAEARYGFPYNTDEPQLFPIRPQGELSKVACE
jgi:hypothetical protein